jgi:hypothetical protein
MSEKKKVSPIVKYGGGGILLLFVIGVVGNIVDPPTPDSGTSNGGVVSTIVDSVAPTPAVTKSEYDALQTGMSYEQAVRIIGQTGEELSRNDLAGFTTVMYQWQNADGSNMNAMFQNGGMVQKAQFGLK